VERCADFTCAAWDRRGNGIWELAPPAEFVSSRVMSWVTLDQAERIARRAGAAVPPRWQAVAEHVRTEVLRRGYSDTRRAFRQRDTGDGLDASALLMPIYDFLPVSDARVGDTIRRIASDLSIDKFVYRFDPARTPGVAPLPLGELEGAFLPCTFWMAAARARMGDVARAERILAAAERVAGPLGAHPRGRGRPGRS
jgi:GH15 family glucan-1,4-alpha-glucosidase